MTKIIITDRIGKFYTVEFYDRRGENWKEDISSYILGKYYGKRYLDGFNSIFYMTQKHYELWSLFFQKCDKIMTQFCIFKRDLSIDELNLLEKLTGCYSCLLMDFPDRFDKIVQNWKFVCFLDKSKLLKERTRYDKFHSSI